MEAFSKIGTSNGESIWKGYKYELPMKNPRVQGFVLKRDSTGTPGLWQEIMSKKPELINHLGETEDKLERDFLPKPVGKKLVMRIENTGSQK